MATITLDQLGNRNALTTALLTEVGEGIGQAVDDDDVRVIVITNMGPAFCAGADLRATGAAALGGEGGGWDLVQLLEAIADSPKPVIGRIAGHCMGGGVGLAAACDISIAADDVYFGFTEVRIGVAPAVVSVVCLPKLRAGDARELFLTGERIGAPRAAEVGLINRAVPRAQLDEATSALVEQLCAGAPGALAASKTLVARVPGMSRNDAFTWTGQLSARLFSAPEGQAGMAAFRDKRPAPWVPV